MLTLADRRSRTGGRAQLARGLRRGPAEAPKPLGARLAGAARGALRLLDKRIFPETADPSQHLVRMVMNEAIAEHLAALHPPSKRAVEISGTAQSELGWQSFEALVFPDFDLCGPLAHRQRYDVVICEQVLEHVADPWAAVRNLRELCEPGGHVVVSTPFMIRVHELPIYAMHDYWRFTPRGLRTLLEGAGLEVIEVGSWGNSAAVVGNLHRWSAYRPWHPMDNAADLPVQVWAFATNPDNRA
jgi:SAM-dependent methyltransferase